jgi:mitochondrial import receptor subunit TOM40
MGFLKRLQSLPNPGRVEELKKEAQGTLSPDVFDGAKFEFNKAFGQKFALNHNVCMGSTQIPGGYEFGANFGDERILLASRIDMAGRLNGRLNLQFGDSAGVRMQGQVSPETPGQPGVPNSAKIDFDYKGSFFTSGLSYMAGGLLSGTHMQSLTENLALGGEAFYHLQKHVSGGAGAARLVWGSKGENVATAKAGTFGNVELSCARLARTRERRPAPPRARRASPRCALSEPSSAGRYHHKVSEKVGLATQLDYYHGQFCTFGVGYEFRMRQATFRGLVSSDTTCSASLEERISPGVNLVLSSQLNHKKKDYKFGIGLNVGGA